jgi:hypothetical protein
MLPIILDGPSISLEDAAGQAAGALEWVQHFLEDSADSLERAQQCFWEVLPMPLDGPRTSLEDVTDTLGRSRRCY